jgi:fatty acid amide hydrolase 2
LKVAFGRSNHTLPALLVAAAGGLVQRLSGQSTGLARAAARLRTELAELLGDRGVLLHPPYTRPAPRHHQVWTTPFDAAYTALFNVMETPVTVVPVGFDHRGMPIGVQVIAAPGRDHVSIRAAGAIEEHFGGWTLATPRGASA